MANDNDNKRFDKLRIPASEGRKFTSWDMPDVANGDIISASKSASRQASRVEDIEIGSHKISGPITVDQLQAITQESFEDGFKQGQEQLVESIRQNAHQQAYAEGQALAQTELQHEVSKLKTIMNGLLSPLNEHQSALEQQLLALLKEATEALAGQALDLDDDILMRMITEAVEALPQSASSITVYLNADDLNRICALSAWPEDWACVADATVMTGGCRVESDASQIDFEFLSRSRQIFDQYQLRKEQRTQQADIDVDVDAEDGSDYD